MSEAAGLGAASFSSYLQACAPEKRELVLGLAACQARRRALTSGSSVRRQNEVQPQQRVLQGTSQEFRTAVTVDTTQQSGLGAAQDEGDINQMAKSEARPDPTTSANEAIRQVDSDGIEKKLQDIGALDHSDNECNKLQRLLLAVAQEAKAWRPASVASWLSRLEAILTPSDTAWHQDANALSKPEAVLEQDDWRRPAWLDPAFGGARAAAVRRSEANLKKLKERAERLKAENDRLRLRCAGAGGGVGIRGDRSSWAEDEEEVQRLCSQALKLAQRVAELQQTRTNLQARLGACKQNSLQQERALLSRIPRSASQPSLPKAAWDDSGRTGYRQPAQDSHYAQRRMLSEK